MARSAGIGLFYGTVSGNTKDAAETIRDAFAKKGISVQLFDVGEAGIDEMKRFDFLILGAPTWDIGELPYDWDEHLGQLDKLDFSGKRVALFGLGDAQGYPETFVDAIGILGEVLEVNGASLMGAVPASDYDFVHSRGLVGNPQNGKLIGLALDYDNEPEKNQERISNWVEQLLDEVEAARAKLDLANR